MLTAALCILTKMKNMLYCSYALEVSQNFYVPPYGGGMEMNMKKRSMMLAMLMALVLLLSATACGGGGSWISRIDRLCDEEEDIAYHRMTRDFLDDLADEIEDNEDDLEGNIVRAYFVQDEDFMLTSDYNPSTHDIEYEVEGSFCCVIEFEKTADAKMVAEYLDDEGEFLYISDPEIMLDVKKVERKGDTIIFGDKSMVKLLVG